MASFRLVLSQHNFVGLEGAKHRGGLSGLLVAFNLEQGGPRAGGKGQLVQPAGGKGLDLP